MVVRILARSNISFMVSSITLDQEKDDKHGEMEKLEGRNRTDDQSGHITVSIQVLTIGVSLSLGLVSFLVLPVYLVSFPTRWVSGRRYGKQPRSLSRCAHEIPVGSRRAARRPTGKAAALGSCSCGRRLLEGARRQLT